MPRKTLVLVAPGDSIALGGTLKLVCGERLGSHLVALSSVAGGGGPRQSNSDLS